MDEADEKDDVPSGETQDAISMNAEVTDQLSKLVDQIQNHKNGKNKQTNNATESSSTPKVEEKHNSTEKAVSVIQ